MQLKSATFHFSFVLLATCVPAKRVFSLKCYANDEDILEVKVKNVTDLTQSLVDCTMTQADAHQERPDFRCFSLTIEKTGNMAPVFSKGCTSLGGCKKLTEAISFVFDSTSLKGRQTLKSIKCDECEKDGCNGGSVGVAIATLGAALASIIFFL